MRKRGGLPVTKSGYERDTVVAFLRSAREAKMEISRYRARVEELESRCTRMTANISAMPGGGNSDAQQLWSALADERRKTMEAERREMETYKEVEAFISKIPNPTHRAILRLRYLSGLSWVKVQMKLYESGIFYSESHIKKLHRQALGAASALWRLMKGGEADG